MKVQKGRESMLSEQDMEDAIANSPERYIENGLKLIARQYRIGKYIFDLLFEDRHGAKLIVELQKGTLDRVHTYKILDYFDEYKDKYPDEFIDLMVIANKITRERRDRLSSYGIAFKEIPKAEFPQSHKKIMKTVQEEIPTTSKFKHPANISDKWERDPLEKIEKWLRQYINRLPIGEPIKVGETAKSSRSIARIEERGNINGFRYLLRKLHNEGFIDFPDNLHFVVLKNINNNK
jgi:hypothetical protein